MEILKMLLESGFFIFLAHLVIAISKCIVAVFIIAKDKNMTDDKVKSITKMMSKDININFPKK